MSSTARSKLGPDEISELAEFLWLRCAESNRRLHVAEPGQYSCNCPLQVAFGSFIITPLAEQDRAAFVLGFDGNRQLRWNSSRAMFELGRRFREQALGEGFK